MRHKTNALYLALGLSMGLLIAAKSGNPVGTFAANDTIIYDTRTGEIVAAKETFRPDRRGWGYYFSWKNVPKPKKPELPEGEAE